MSFTREVLSMVKNNVITMRIPVPIPLIALQTIKYEPDTVGDTGGYITITATTTPTPIPEYESVNKKSEPIYIKNGS